MRLNIKTKILLVFNQKIKPYMKTKLLWVLKHKPLMVYVLIHATAIIWLIAFLKYDFPLNNVSPEIIENTQVVANNNVANDVLEKDTNNQNNYNFEDNTKFNLKMLNESQKTFRFFTKTNDKLNAFKEHLKIRLEKLNFKLFCNNYALKKKINQLRQDWLTEKPATKAAEAAKSAKTAAKTAEWAEKMKEFNKEQDELEKDSDRNAKILAARKAAKFAAEKAEKAAKDARFIERTQWLSGEAAGRLLEKAKKRAILIRTRKSRYKAKVAKNKNEID